MGKGGNKGGEGVRGGGEWSRTLRLFRPSPARQGSALFAAAVVSVHVDGWRLLCTRRQHLPERLTPSQFQLLPYTADSVSARRAVTTRGGKRIVRGIKQPLLRLVQLPAQVLPLFWLGLLLLLCVGGKRQEPSKAIISCLPFTEHHDLRQLSSITHHNVIAFVTTFPAGD